MIRVCVEFEEQSHRHHHRDEIRLIPVLGPVTEQSAPVAKTPEFQSPTPKHSRTILMATLTDSQQVTVSVKLTDKKGNPAQAQDPTWTTDNSDVLALTPSADGLSCVVAAVGPLTAPGTGAMVTFTADADMGAGVTPLMGTAQFTVTAGQATVVALDVGPAVEQP